ncbi:microfibril-associated glycoprotein 4-like [Anopheles coustani]|uniref:microfibril-associated glycoprotein 4-like n=1 Tax=Anopheles coustani TaxID=139045 RepID=UPI0026599284|nr:microfibril-associated glycoprotein 4-like [Anopheles coustani]
MDILTAKVDLLQDKLQELKQTMKTTIESSLKENNQASNERHVNLQNQLAKLEKDVTELGEKLHSKLETAMHGMEQSLKKQVVQSVKTSEDVTQAILVDLESQFNSKIENLKHQIDQNKTYQETSQVKFEKLGEFQKFRSVSSCRQALNVSGKYMIKIGAKSIPFVVYCEHDEFDGGWTVIQHRFDGSVDFYRDWDAYRNGFGSLDGEFWVGLEYVHQMTKNRPHELLVEIKDFHGNYGYAKYGEFEIGNETELYVLKKLGTYSGTAGDALQANKDHKFSTFDRDNDLDIGNCAKGMHGAWWYELCTVSNLNGRYENTTSDISAMSWAYFKMDWRGLSYSRMMIREIMKHDS